MNMSSAFTPTHIPYKKYEVVLALTASTFGCNYKLHPLTHEGVALHCRLDVRDVGTGISRSWEAFHYHLLRRHTQTTVPEWCAKGVEDLTGRIVRMHTYPMAYGGFSDVWSCQLLYKQSPPERVAVKVVRPGIANIEESLVKRKAIEQERNVWFGLDHPNVLPLYGTTMGFGPFPAFVCPWADNGTLSEYLEKYETELDMKRRMTLLSNIADGLQYLHSRNIIHGDLSGSNILINKNGRACLSDFGLSALFEQVPDTMASGISSPGNVRWAAPELIDRREDGTPPSQSSGQQADIYSFGSIMLQTLSGKLPFHGIQRVAEIVIMIARGKRPPQELRWDGRPISDVLWNFIETCWDSSPSKRPSSAEIVNFIKSQLSRL